MSFCLKTDYSDNGGMLTGLPLYLMIPLRTIKYESAINKNTSYTHNSENKPSCVSSTDKPRFTLNVLNSLHPLCICLEVVSNILFSCVPPFLILCLKLKGTSPIIVLHHHHAFCPNFYNLQFL